MNRRWIFLEFVPQLLVLGRYATNRHLLCVGIIILLAIACSSGGDSSGAGGSNSLGIACVTALGDACSLYEGLSPEALKEVEVYCRTYGNMRTAAACPKGYSGCCKFTPGVDSSGIDIGAATEYDCNYYPGVDGQVELGCVNDYGGEWVRSPSGQAAVTSTGAGACLGPTDPCGQVASPCCAGSCHPTSNTCCAPIGLPCGPDLPCCPGLGCDPASGCVRGSP